MKPPDVALLQLMRLVSPALPIGAFAYSRGLELAVEMGWVRDESTACSWITGLLEQVMGRLDAPVLARLHAGWSARDTSVATWSRWLAASRESHEIRLEEQHMGQALARLLVSLGVSEAESWVEHPDRGFATLFALAATHWQISERATLVGYLWAWAEAQTSAAVRLVPLGQTSGQRILSEIIERVPGVVDEALQLKDDELGGVAHGQAIASALHETMYSRLFRS